MFLSKNWLKYFIFFCLVVSGTSLYVIATPKQNAKTPLHVLTPIPTNSVEPEIIPISAEKLMSIVNDWRYSQGFQPYTQNETLCTIASERLIEIQKDWSHSGFQAEHDKYIPSSYMAENLARQYNSETDTFSGWLASPTHRANLDANYRYSCIKCENNYCVQEFANL